MREKQVKIIALNVLSLIAGLTINVVLDKHLAKSEKPGKINKFTRRQLKFGRKYGWVMAGLGIATDLMIENAQHTQTLDVTLRNLPTAYDRTRVLVHEYGFSVQDAKAYLVDRQMWIKY